MSQHPRTVAVETWITWDGMPVRLPRGQVIDVTPGSALEQAIGRDRLVSPRGMPLPPPVEPVEPAEAVVQGAGGGGAAQTVTVGGGGGGGGAVEVTPVSPPRSRTAGKKQDNAKDGAS